MPSLQRPLHGDLFFGLINHDELSAVRKDKQATEERESQRHFFLDTGVEHCILSKLPPLPGMQGGECRRRKKDNAVKSLKGPEEGGMSGEASTVLGPAAYSFP